MILSNEETQEIERLCPRCKARMNRVMQEDEQCSDCDYEDAEHERFVNEEYYGIYDD